MATSSHHLRFLAELIALRRGGAGVERLGNALHDAQIDLNPHQIDAALFAFKSPLQDGVILADEVGLGKTIEAGLVMLQHWSEGSRRILVICPASLRNQWGQELQDKFFLSSVIFETPSWNAATDNGQFNPFEQPEIVICSYHFASARAEHLALMSWDLVVVDEAHRLRNVYKPDNKIARALRTALQGRRKLLLTATPLQNSLLELYGLVSFIDEYAFGDVRSFRARYSRLSESGSFDQLRDRLRPYCHRTLRRQVTEYVSYTQRIPITQEFAPSDDEQRLYDRVSAYLQRDQLYALPSGQRTLMTLILRKLLASSTFAIAGALETMLRRLQARLRNDDDAQAGLQEELEADYENLDETAEEWVEPPITLSSIDRALLLSEIAELQSLRDQAIAITENTKGQALVQALDIGLAKARELGAQDKVLIFTESRRTQSYLLRLLTAEGRGNDIVLFNGSNTDPQSRQIYRDWLLRHQGSDRISGSRTADTRAALVDAFRENASIMIATEAAAEGINLQFCSLVVNYDLPWNPQRIEQRIGRCHRYGQQHDVVVVNFLNSNNAADQRVFQLLEEKFQLFSGVFGASDEVLGAVESGVNFQQRIAAIYQTGRDAEQIQQQFDQLQLELETQIDATLQQTRQQLLEHFDADVHDRLRVNLEQSRSYLGKLEQNLWLVTRAMLGEYASFNDVQKSFELIQRPPGLDALNDNQLMGKYRMVRFPEDGHKYRLQHPVAQWVLEKGRSLATPDANLQIDYAEHLAADGARYSRIEALCGQTGWLHLERLTVSSAGVDEQHLLLAAIDASGRTMNEDTTYDLLRVSGKISDLRVSTPPSELQTSIETISAAILGEIGERNHQYFLDAVEKLDNRASDLKNGLESEIKILDKEIRGKRTEARTVADLEAKLVLHRKIAQLERDRNGKRKGLFEMQDQIDLDKEALIDEVQLRLRQDTESECFFRLRWEIA